MGRTLRIHDRIVARSRSLTHLFTLQHLVSFNSGWIICSADVDSRSPMAEAVLNHRISRRTSLKGKYELEVDSAGTGAYHAGDEADER